MVYCDVSSKRDAGNIKGMGKMGKCFFDRIQGGLLLRAYLDPLGLTNMIHFVGQETPCSLVVAVHLVPDSFLRVGLDKFLPSTQLLCAQ